MPGVDLQLVLPTAGDNMATFRAKLVTALEAIAADLEPRITAGMLDLTTELSMGGAPLINVGGIRLSGGESAEVGTLYVDDELHVVTAAGDIQLTSNGGLNIASVGTIGGDYGGINPAEVTYDDLSGEYRFTEAPGEWADVVFDDAILRGAIGSVRLGVEAGLSGAQTFLFRALPTSGVGGLAFDGALSAVVDPSVTRETLTHLFTDINCSGRVTAASVSATNVYHSTLSAVTPLTLYRAGWFTGGTQMLSSIPAAGYTRIPAADEARWPMEGLKAGNRVLTATLKGAITGVTPVLTFYIQNRVTTSAALPVVWLGGGFSVDGYYSVQFSPGVTLAEGDILWASVVGGSGTADVYSMTIGFDNPAP